MNDWQFLKFEYRMYRMQYGWRKALRLAIKANKLATDNIPF